MEDGAAADKPGKGIESGQSTARGVFADKNPKHLALGKNILQQRVGINGADKLLRRFHNKRMRHITEWICELLRNHLKKDFNSFHSLWTGSPITLKYEPSIPVIAA